MDFNPLFGGGQRPPPQQQQQPQQWVNNASSLPSADVTASTGDSRETERRRDYHTAEGGRQLELGVAFSQQRPPPQQPQLPLHYYTIQRDDGTSYLVPENYLLNATTTSTNITRSSAVAAGGSSSRRGPPFVAQSQVDEAVRRLGDRLSRQAHGGDSTFVLPSTANAQQVPFRYSFEHSSFTPLVHHPTIRDTSSGRAISHSTPTASESTITTVQYDQQALRRTTKVAKTGYADHGEHTLPPQERRRHAPSSSLLRRLIFECRDRFAQWQQVEAVARLEQASIRRDGHGNLLHTREVNLSDPAANQQQPVPQTSPHRHAFSLLALDSAATPAGTGPPGRAEVHSSSLNLPMFQQRDEASLTNEIAPSAGTRKGLLSAILEGQSDGGGAANYPSQQRRQMGVDPVRGRGSRDSSLSDVARHSISTDESLSGGGPLSSSSLGDASQPMEAAAPSLVSARGRCLTNPSEPAENGNLDNIEGNLIVYERDSILVPPHALRVLSNGASISSAQSAEFRILSLQGQGTFAQVFQCLHVESGQRVALKIVKNKTAYTRQAAIEIDIFQRLQEDPIGETSDHGYMVQILSYFMHRNHLCLVFELLGLNLYEVLKRRQFRGLPLNSVRDILKQSVEGIRNLTQKSVVHCDLKPENILLASEDVNERVIAAGESGRVKKERSSSGMDPVDVTRGSSTPLASGDADRQFELPCQVKLIDFGSACFEGYASHTYIQSRFYRSPEVLIGLPYDSAIDMWSLGCVAAELFLGLPILPGVHEHDQIARITEMISNVPTWMLEQGSKSTKYYVKESSQRSNYEVRPARTTPSLMIHDEILLAQREQWRLKHQEEYVSSLSAQEVSKKGGLDKLNKPQGNRYFNRTKLSDIVVLHGQTSVGEDKDMLSAFVHFLYGLLDPDPWKRFTAFQAAQHPFLTGDLSQLRIVHNDFRVDASKENHANLVLGLYWSIPIDPSINRRRQLWSIQSRNAIQRSPSLTGLPIHSHTPTIMSRGGSERFIGDGSTISYIPQPDRQLNTSSPPIQISSFSQLQLPRSRDTSRAYLISSSWTGHDETVTRSHLTSEALLRSQGGAVRVSRQMLSGPQSYQGIEYTPVATDFTHALQRPGVFPASMGNVHQPQFSGQNYARIDSQHIQHTSRERGGVLANAPLGMQYSGGTFTSIPSSFAPAPRDRAGNVRDGTVLYGPDFSSQVCYSLQDGQSSIQTTNVYGSRNAIATYNDTPIVDPQQFAMLRQQQLQQIEQQQQQERQLLGLFQQQQRAQMDSIQLQTQPATPRIQAPGEGQYYVSTPGAAPAAFGHPMIRESIEQPQFAVSSDLQFRQQYSHDQRDAYSSGQQQRQQ